MYGSLSRIAFNALIITFISICILASLHSGALFSRSGNRARVQEIELQPITPRRSSETRRQTSQDAIPALSRSSRSFPRLLRSSSQPKNRTSQEVTTPRGNFSKYRFILESLEFIIDQGYTGKNKTTVGLNYDKSADSMKEDILGDPDLQDLMRTHLQNGAAIYEIGNNFRQTGQKDKCKIYCDFLEECLYTNPTEIRGKTRLNQLRGASSPNLLRRLPIDYDCDTSE